MRRELVFAVRYLYFWREGGGSGHCFLRGLFFSVAYLFIYVLDMRACVRVCVGSKYAVVVVVVVVHVVNVIECATEMAETSHTGICICACTSNDLFVMRVSTLIVEYTSSSCINNRNWYTKQNQQRSLGMTKMYANDNTSVCLFDLFFNSN